MIQNVTIVISDPFIIEITMSKKTIAVIMLMAIVLGCHKNSITVATTEADIRAHLHIGSSRSDVVSYLNGREIYHARFQAFQETTNSSTVFPNKHTEECLIRDVRTVGCFAGTTRVNIQILFNFDETDTNLISYTVNELYR